MYKEKKNTSSQKLYSMLLVDEAGTWYTRLWYEHQHVRQVCFYSSQITTLAAIVNFSSLRLIMGKVEIGYFFCLIGDI